MKFIREGDEVMRKLSMEFEDAMKEFNMLVIPSREMLDLLIALLSLVLTLFLR